VSANSASISGAIYNQMGGTVTLENCTLTGSSAHRDGSGIYNQTGGTLILESCTLSGNSANTGGAILNGGTATLTNCTLSGNSANGNGAGFYDGGGIYNQMGGTLTLENCALTGNSAHGDGGGVYDGGGICNGGTLTLKNSTLSGNSTGVNSGAGGGGGICNGGTLTLENCTLSGNSSGAGGAIAYGAVGGVGGGTATLTNCTLSGNSAGAGGAIFGFGDPVTLENTIIANSPRGGNCYSPQKSNGHNLDDDGGCGFFDTGDLSIVPAQLAPLGDYGGPTQTHALCSGPGMPHPDCMAASPAIDAGDNAHCPAADQRGAPRPHGSACDIGAYESSADAMPGSCQGDCGSDGAVTVNEIITMVNIALGTANVSACTAGDADGSGDITINEIIAAVNNALNGCVAG
jgi:hypothetical protein